MIQMIAKRKWWITLAAGTDRVMFGLTLPAGSRLNAVHAEIHIMATPINEDEISMYAVEGWILPLVDPDGASAATFDAHWDNMVPKDTDVQTLDLDFGTSDTAPFFEPGEMDFGELFPVGLRPRRIHQHSKMLSAASTKSFHRTEVPADKFFPNAMHNIHIRKRFPVRNPSLLLVGFANPMMDDTTVTVESPLTEAEIPQVQYIEQVLERALMDLLGITEATAETPWEEATDLLQKYLEPNVLEDSGGKFSQGQYSVAGQAVMNISVPGTFPRMSIGNSR